MIISIKHYLKGLSIFIGLLLVSISNSASAVCDRIAVGPIFFDLPTNISINRDIPVGSTIYASAPRKVSDDVGAKCDMQLGLGLVNLIGAQPSIAAADPVFPTSIPGLGYRIKLIEGNVTRYATPFGAQLTPIGEYLTKNVYVGFELIKTGAIKSGAKISSTPKFASYRYGDAEVLRLFLSGETTIVSPTCITQNVSVSMGSQEASKFSGINSSLSPVSFAISLVCSQGYNSIKYRLTPGPKIVDQAESVIELDASSSASGIGVQILDNLGKPLPLNVDIPLANNVAIASNFSIPLKAAYYKTKNAVKGGTANTSLTFTMNYQ